MVGNTRFLAPRFWPTWLGVGFLHLLNLLPFTVQIRLGRWVGDMMYRLFKRRRHVVEVNLQLCFPELSTAERQLMVRDVFRNNAIGIFETSMGWWMSDRRFSPDTRLKGQEHLEAALAKGRGVILLGAHFSTLDLGGRLFSRFYDVNVMYRAHNNPLMEEIIKKGRERHLKSAIERESLRTVLRALRRNEIVWYAPDQDFGPKYSVYAPFFGVPAATITATSRMVKLNNSPILMYTHHRNADDQGYELELFPEIEDFPSGDDVADATRINQEIERAIRKDPTQYMWVHRRFKTHPQGKNFLYKQ